LLNISNATLNCSTLDVARNLTGAFEQHGTVNLNGGTLMVNSILKDASTNTSTGARQMVLVHFTDSDVNYQHTAIDLINQNGAQRMEAVELEDTNNRVEF